MKYFLKDLYYVQNDSYTLMIMEEVDGTIKYKDIFTNTYYLTSQIVNVTKFLDEIKFNNLGVLITDNDGHLIVSADLDKLKYILKILTEQKRLPKTVEMKARKVGNEVTEIVVNNAMLNPKDCKYAIKASNLGIFKDDISNSLTRVLTIDGSVNVYGKDDYKLKKAFLESKIKSDDIEFNNTISATINGDIKIKDMVKESKPDFQKLLRKQ